MIRTLGLILSLALLACARIGAPDIIPPEKMRIILRDFLLAGGVVELEPHNLRGKDNIRRNLNTELLQSYGVTNEEFYTSYAYYIQHATEMDTLFQWVIKDLQRLQKEVPPATKRDSVANPSVSGPDGSVRAGSPSTNPGALAKPR